MSLIDQFYPTSHRGGLDRPPLARFLTDRLQGVRAAYRPAPLPARLLAYIAAMLACGIALTALCLHLYPLPTDWQGWGVLAAFVVLTALSDRYGLHLTHGARVHVDTIPLFAGVLIFNPAAAMLMAGLGRLLGRIDGKRSALESVFNIGQTWVYVGVSSLLLHQFTAAPWLPSGLGAWAGLGVAALAMFAVNSAAVVGVVHLQNRTSIGAIWRASAPQVIREHAVMFGFGLIFVLVVVPYPWGVVLVALPSVAVFVLLDRTLKMEARQTQLAERNASLAADLSVQAQELRETGEVLRDALAAKTQMLRNVSHELRTPMVSITGYTEALMEGVFGDLNGEQQSVLEIVSRSTWHMVNLVDDLLTLQALDRKGLCLRPVRMETLFEHCRERHSEKAREAGIDLRFDIEPCTPEVWADEARLEQALSHLIDNAIKFSPNGGVIAVSCRPIDDDRIHISVQDHGIGIPADELPKIYRSFYQVDGSATRRFSGQGLGLAITQRIVELHGGEIRAESVLGRGSRFTIELPLREADSGPDDPRL